VAKIKPGLNDKRALHTANHHASIPCDGSHLEEIAFHATQAFLDGMIVREGAVTVFSGFPCPLGLQEWLMRM
jgi:hypothetical protein